MSVIYYSTNCASNNLTFRRDLHYYAADTEMEGTLATIITLLSVWMQEGPCVEWWYVVLGWGLVDNSYPFLQNVIMAYSLHYTPGT